MVGIVGCGAYVPRFRLGPGTNGWKAQSEKAIASYDEDSVTMAVAAAIDCLKDSDRSSIDGLFFASTTSPYSEKVAAAIVATATDLRPDILTVDFANSLRAGSSALNGALDAVKAGRAKQILVVVSDMRVPKPGTEFETIFGDGAAAFLVGDSKVAAKIDFSYGFTDEIWDVWRPAADAFVRSWEDRFGLEAGYVQILSRSTSSLLRKANLTSANLAKAVFYAPDARRHREMSKILGLDPTQVQNPLLDSLGNTGAAFAPMMLVAALESTKPGDKLLFANYGNGSDALLVEATSDISNVRGRRGMKGHLESKMILEEYQKYLQWKGLADLRGGGSRPATRNPSAAALWRERDTNIRFYGVKCRNCGTSQIPPQRMCTICHARDQFDRVRFSDKRSRLFTYSMDFISPHPDAPQVFGIIDFEAGGRMITEMTDRIVSEVRIDMPLEMVFREMNFLGGIHNYSWKCAPLRA